VTRSEEILGLLVIAAAISGNLKTLVFNLLFIWKRLVQTFHRKEAKPEDL